MNVDGLIEYHSKGYVFIETKAKGAPLPRGQELALERLCDDLQSVKPTLLIVAEHEASEGEDIDVANTTVREFRWKGGWHQREGTTKQLIDGFLAHIDGLWGERAN